MRATGLRLPIGRPVPIRDALRLSLGAAIIAGAAAMAGLDAHAAGDAAGAAPAGWGAKPSASYDSIRAGFADPDMIYAPFCFWFWDEPLISGVYPDKARAMAREMLKQGLNPGYTHPRVSMADLIGPKHMAPSPSLPKEQWLSPEWFEAYGAALEEAEAASGYLGFVDDYMWPMGRAAGRVIKAQPELANASLQWRVTDLQGGATAALPSSFFTVAARLVHRPDPSAYAIPASESAFELVEVVGSDLHGKASLGQTVVVTRRRLVEATIAPACWKSRSDATFTIEARLSGPDGDIVASRHVTEGIRQGDTVSLPIPELLPVGTLLYIGLRPDTGLPENELGWWSKPDDVYPTGQAFENGIAVVGDRYVSLSYLTRPEQMQGQWIWQSASCPVPHTCFIRRVFELAPGQQPLTASLRIAADNRYRLFVNGSYVGTGDDWGKPGTYEVARLLQPGRNVVAVEAGGDGGTDALLVDLRVDLADGSELRVLSDAASVVSPAAGSGWAEAAFDDAGWAPVREIGPADAAPWSLPEARSPYQQATIESTSLRIIGEGEAFDWTAPADGNWRVYTFQRVVGGDVNVIDERLASAYIAQSHQPYADRFGDRMGRSIPGVFCDTEGNYGNGNGLVWSDSLAPRYLANTGRDIRLWAPLLLDDDAEGLSARARFDWFEAVSDLYAGFYAEVSDWLAARGMYYIANVWEESLQWQASCVSDHFKVQRAFSMPGTDCLSLKAYDVHDFKEAQSVAEFEGRRLQSEIMGAGGWTTFTTVTMKECTNAVIAWGVNHIVPHGVFMTRVLEGNVWTPDWFDRNPMWSSMHVWSDFARRASYINSQGRVEPDVLLLNPMESVWALLGRTDKLWWSPEAGNVGLIDKLYSQRVQDINAVYSDAIRQLSTHRVEYIIADRHYLRQMTVDEDRLVRGEFRFRTIVLPPLVILPLDVASRIVEFAKAGGRVYTLGDLPAGSTDNGLFDPAMAALMRDLQAQPTVKACAGGLVEALEAGEAGLASPVRFVSGEFPMLQLRRHIDGRDFYWLANNSTEPRECEVRVTGVCGGAEIWDCENGAVRTIRASAEGADTRIALAFQPHQGFWLVVDPSLDSSSAPEMTLGLPTALAELAGPWRVTLDPEVQPNLEHPVDIPDVWLTREGAPHELSLWETWPETPAKFSGLLDYTTTIELPAFQGDLVLDLGTVRHFADVWVNGSNVATRLWPPHVFQTDAFRPGSNEIRVRVGNLVNNNYGIESPSGLVGPVRLMSGPRK